MTMTTASLNGRAHTGRVTDDDIDPAARPRRRTFSAEHKAEILAEYDSHPKGSEERGAILRREGLYSSHLAEWPKAAEAGARDGLPGPANAAPRKRSSSSGSAGATNGSRPSWPKTKTALEITGKVHALLE